MSGMHAHTVLTGIYSRGIFRICIHPDPVDRFPPLPVSQEPENPEHIPVHRDAQGMLRARKRSLQYIFDPPTGNFKLLDGGEELLSGTVSTGQFTTPMLAIGMKSNDVVFGYGNASGRPFRNGESFRLLNRDTLYYSVPGASYSSFPVFIIKRDDRFLGVYCNTSFPADVTVDGARTDSHRMENRMDFLTDGEAIPIDLFVFYGTLPEILDSYTYLLGRPFLPPVWALGYHQSRWSYKTQERVLDVARRFRSEGIPCDAIHLDIDYMDRYRIFTWHPKRFPDPARMHQELLEMGIRTVAIVDPAVPAAKEYPLFEEGRRGGYFCQKSNGELYTGHLWAGRSAFPDFTKEKSREWWARSHAPLFRAGVQGIWNDMNEPVLKKGTTGEPSIPLLHEEGSHRKIRNLYANREAVATEMAFQIHVPDKRPFILSRAGHCGIQQYAAMWTGDIHSTWQHLRESLYRTINLGLSGVAMNGSDVGGFASGPGFRGNFKWRRNGELFSRWMELGSLMPFFRAHTVRFSLSQEPWCFGEDVKRNAIKHIRRRYRLMPYLYNLIWESHLTGAPVVRPLFYEFPGLRDPLEDQFMVGPSLLAAPILAPGITERRLYLPEGRWYHYETGKRYEGDRWITEEVYPGSFPLFIRGGAILPVAESVESAHGALQSPLCLEIYPSAVMEGSLRLDDGLSRKAMEGEQFQQTYSGAMDQNGTIELQLTILRKRFSPAFDMLRIRLPESYRTMVYRGKREEGRLRDLVMEDRNITVSEFEIPLSAGTAEFLYRGAWSG